MNSIIFMGTPDFAVPILAGLIKDGYEVKAVVTQPDKKVGRKQILRKTPVKQAAIKLGLPVFTPSKLAKSEVLDELCQMHADLIVTAAYGQFLPSKFLQSVKIAAVNVHGSLLPKYRGGAPIQYALLNGDQQTGISIMEMVKKMDAGDIYAQQALTIEPEDTTGSLFSKLSIMGRDLLLKTLPKIVSGAVQKKAQNEDEVIFSPNISKEEEQIKLTMTATQANNLIRALNPSPGAYLQVAGQRFKIWRARISKHKSSQNLGSIESVNNCLAVVFAEQTVLELLEVQPAGKKRLPIKSFLNGQGNKLARGDQFGDE